MSFAQDFTSLSEIIGEIENLNAVNSLLAWDQNTYLPEQGFLSRGKQMATVGKIIHEKLTSPKVGELLERLKAQQNLEADNNFKSRYITLVERNYIKAQKIPAKYIQKLVEHQSATYNVWVKAKETNNFKIVQPYLEKTLEYSREYANFFNYKHIADPLIAESDYGFDTETVRKIFNDLKIELVPFVKKVLDISQSKNIFSNEKFSVSLQEKLNSELLNKFGFDFSRGRLDKTAHPFMIGMSHGDVRITTRYDENNLYDSLFSSVHEMGHAFYEMGIAKEFEGTPLFGGISSAVHESQSRLWENIVARSYEFWQYFYPTLKIYFPEQLNSVSLSSFYEQINKVERSFIRTESDELTYNLHVLIRFQLELDLLEDKLKISDLPSAWNALYKENLGLSVPNDTMGCLQDVHWFCGMIGGQFQGYTLGNIMSAQIFAAAQNALPNLAHEIKAGQFLPLRNWLIENVYQHGKMYDSLELLEKATNENLTSQPYMNYLKKKFPIKNLT